MVQKHTVWLNIKGNGRWRRNTSTSNSNLMYNELLLLLSLNAITLLLYPLYIQRNGRKIRIICSELGV